jgi:hypothetical protein
VELVEEPGSPSSSKRERRDERRRVAHRRVVRKRLRRAGIVAAVLAIPVLWSFENAGSQERVDAQVIETRLRKHYTDVGSHSHTSATLQIEGLSEAVIDRADGYERGQRVAVWIRRGRISGWPYFLDLVKPGEAKPGEVKPGELDVATPAEVAAEGGGQQEPEAP